MSNGDSPADDCPFCFGDPDEARSQGAFDARHATSSACQCGPYLAARQCEEARPRRRPRARRLLMAALGVVSWGCGEPPIDRHIKWQPTDAGADVAEAGVAEQAVERGAR